MSNLSSAFHVKSSFSQSRKYLADGEALLGKRFEKSLFNLVLLLLKLSRETVEV
jgi:hypothetical protein